MLKSKLDTINCNGKTLAVHYVKNSAELFFRCEKGNLYMKMTEVFNGLPKWQRAIFNKWKPKIFLSNRA